jgi:hypothetical protein
VLPHHGERQDDVQHQKQRGALQSDQAWDSVCRAAAELLRRVQIG